MMHTLKYSFAEAAGSLLRGWRSAAVAVLTIGAGLFVLGCFLVVNTNLRHVIARWAESAELSVYLRDDVTPAQRQMIEELVAASGLAGSRQVVSKAEALGRFKQDFPDLAETATGLGRNPFPASIEVRLKPDAREASGAVDALASTLSGLPGVAEVKYDRRWLSRLNAAIRFVGSIGLLFVVMLALAAALTVANVVRLAASARRDEIEIMQLVGAPIGYVRGPFVVEGILQGGAGALLAILSLAAVFAAGRARYGGIAAEALGLGTLRFMPLEASILLVLGGMMLGCLGGFVVARGVR